MYVKYVCMYVSKRGQGGDEAPAAASWLVDSWRSMVGDTSSGPGLHTYISHAHLANEAESWGLNF